MDMRSEEVGVRAGSTRRLLFHSATRMSCDRKPPIRILPSQRLCKARSTTGAELSFTRVESQRTEQQPARLFVRYTRRSRARPHVVVYRSRCCLREDGRGGVKKAKREGRAIKAREVADASAAGVHT